MESITENQYRPDCLEAIAEWIVGFAERQRMDMIDYQLLSYFFAGLFDDFNEIKVSDGKGTWTKEAIVTIVEIQQKIQQKIQFDYSKKSGDML